MEFLLQGRHGIDDKEMIRDKVTLFHSLFQKGSRVAKYSHASIGGHLLKTVPLDSVTSLRDLTQTQVARTLLGDRLLWYQCCTCDPWLNKALVYSA